MKPHPTRNGLPSNAKPVAVEPPDARIAGRIDLAPLTRLARRNVHGPRLIAVHAMLDGFHAGIGQAVDADTADIRTPVPRGLDKAPRLLGRARP